jgi:hypothetical protein
MRAIAKFCLVISVFIFTVMPSVTAFADEGSEKKAVASADAWLKFVDNGRYAESWETGSELFKAAGEKEQWAKTVEAVRGPLGKVLKRKLKSKQFMTSLPGAPDGKYVVIQYDTSFENKKTAVETVTPMLDKDGKWRVSGYYIR